MSEIDLKIVQVIVGRGHELRPEHSQVMAGPRASIPSSRRLLTLTKGQRDAPGKPDRPWRPLTRSAFDDVQKKKVLKEPIRDAGS